MPVPRRSGQRIETASVVPGQGLGGALLADALHRTARPDIAAYALVADAKDEPAASFYRHHGFIALPDAALTLFLPLTTAHGMSRS